jgi:antitoxin YefM
VLSKETSYSQARANLASILDEVIDQQQIFVIKRRNGKNVALIAEDELSSLLECVYLMRSPENARRLHRALEWSELEEAQPQTIDELKQELGVEPKEKETTI